ncbi:hypothetical protein C347_01892 [Cryptococcus neoformans AD2-60a]|nr:hypothetical protein C347_01892 [Cryptococcus neoformans var. grubii AD2-60a]OWZ55714.1 hypothetical protein C368_02654 [Cryptococcus neoformans var. grubii 125.91]OXC85910.1 hypothetical protein C344_01799 [Cryptococcus neoformans var. grubii AD1-7a]OXG34661.1 hypothetical protein C359_06118 [Cryptococcus neoformans var. grubii Bt120]OXG38103.1 hypothetical protein C360_01860 [Cryptococcus neoformans var. grubii Bt15]OXG86783.1 hypothetical protein C349_01916 [Cryptococcus neoformans var. 
MPRFLFTFLFVLLSAQFCLAQRLATRIDEDGHTIVITGPNGYNGVGTLPSTAISMSTSVPATPRMTMSRLDDSTMSSTPSPSAVDSWRGDTDVAWTESPSASDSSSNTSAATASSTEKSVAVNGAVAAATDASATTAQTNASAVMSHAQNSATLSMPLNLGSVIGITLTGAVSLCASIVW